MNPKYLQMKKHTLFLLMLLLLCGISHAQIVDSVDVLDYDVSLDLRSAQSFSGDATLTLRLLQPCQSISLSLQGTADTIWVGGSMLVDSPSLAAIPTASYAAGDTLTVRIRYSGNGYVESYGWGGFHFDNDMSYNLGVGFNANPHVMGRAIMPCRDNFHDKATYTLRLHTRNGWSAECGGQLVSRTVESDNTERSVWRIGQPVSTYLVSVSQAAWNRIHCDVSSLYGTYPVTVGYTFQDSAHVARAFRELDSVVPMFERCLGPYRWGRIGYISTLKGSMEHVNNIALDRRFINSTTEQAQMTIAHELGHAWFGNLITCSTEADMWINEGGASFCSELAMEANKGREASNTYYQTNLESVIRRTHISDGGYRPLSPMPHANTYGSTTYDKGWMVWHSLRGYLGDSLFYSAIRRLMESMAFDNADALQVRDSLSAYSGVDLTAFFDFHVFTPGFVEYNVQLLSSTGNVATLLIRQQTVGANTVVHANRVPVTFFSATGDTATRVISFDGAQHTATVPLPFNPVFCVLDYDMAISDAATLARFTKSGTSNPAHVRLSGSLPDGALIAVEHHWGHPWDLDTLPALRRSAERYWVVRGAEPQYHGVTGKFRYVRANYSNSDYSQLDPTLYRQAASLDSIVLLYREAYGAPWQSVSHRHSESSDEGYFEVDNLRPGEYTLAVVDTNLLSISPQSPLAASHSPFILFPNPLQLQRGESLTFDLALDGPFSVCILDATGRRVWQKNGCHNGQRIRPRLSAGTYLVVIKNKFVSLQSKLIVL